MSESIFTQLSLVLAIAAGISILMRLLKQPLIMGYILTGIIVGPAVLGVVEAKEAFDAFAKIGIALLLFIIGLGLNAAAIRSLGRVVMFTAWSILVVIGAIGFAMSKGVGFSGMEALIVGVALFFSSTIIILKVLTDKKEQSRLYGRIAIGVILVDDIVATLALVLVAAIGSTGGLAVDEVGLLIAKGVGLGALLVLCAAKLLPLLARTFAGSQELLFLFTVAWGFGVASVFDVFGFSLEVGALFAGVSLASLPYAVEMSTRLKPLRDFFLVLFFVMLGETFGFSNISQALWPALALSAIVLIGKPLLVMGTLGYMGYTKFTSFKAGIHLSQISEFSILLVVFAYSQGVVSQEVNAVITLVALITIGISTYLMNFDTQLYNLIQKQLSIFERGTPKREKNAAAVYKLVLFGYHKGGHEFVRAFREMKKPYVVVDYNPDVIDALAKQHIAHMYGDAADYELLEELHVAKADMVVSVIPDLVTNLLLVQYVRRRNKDAVFICHADSYDEAAELYKYHVSYVILPHFIGSQRVSAFIRQHGTDKNAFSNYRANHLAHIGGTALR